MFAELAGEGHRSQTGHVGFDGSTKVMDIGKWDSGRS